MTERERILSRAGWKGSWKETGFGRGLRNRGSYWPDEGSFRWLAIPSSYWRSLECIILKQTSLSIFYMVESHLFCGGLGSDRWDATSTRTSSSGKEEHNDSFRAPRSLAWSATDFQTEISVNDVPLRFNALAAGSPSTIVSPDVAKPMLCLFLFSFSLFV